MRGQRTFFLIGYAVRVSKYDKRLDKSHCPWRMDLATLVYKTPWQRDATSQYLWGLMENTSHQLPPQINNQSRRPDEGSGRSTLQHEQWNCRPMGKFSWQNNVTTSSSPLFDFRGGISMSARAFRDTWQLRVTRFTISAPEMWFHSPSIMTDSDAKRTSWSYIQYICMSPYILTDLGKIISDSTHFTI
jgi:hypothetical protein